MTNEVKARKCRRCGEDYGPEYYDLLDLHILKGDGYCKTCAQKVYDEELAREEAAKVAEIAGTRMKRRETCGIPPKFIAEDFSTFEKGWQDRALKRCQQYADKFPVDRRPRGFESLYLWSTDTWGSGKTHLSCAILHRILDRWKGDTNKGCPRVIFLSEPELFRQIQATYSFTSEEKRLRESEDDIIKRIIYADLVVLDDIGKVAFKDLTFLRRVIFDIINGRYDRNLPLIITANLSPAKLEEHVGSASWNRIWEMVKGKSVRMDGKSYRQR